MVLVLQLGYRCRCCRHSQFFLYQKLQHLKQSIEIICSIFGSDNILLANNPVTVRAVRVAQLSLLASFNVRWYATGWFVSTVGFDFVVCVNQYLLFLVQLLFVCLLSTLQWNLE